MSTAATNLVKSLADINPSIPNVPFGDTKRKLNDDDINNSTAYSNSNMNSYNIDVLASNKGNILGFGHKKI